MPCGACPAQVCSTDLLIRAAADVFSGVCRFETAGGHVWRSDTKEPRQPWRFLYETLLSGHGESCIAISLRSDELS